ncbi:hypothetical protein BDA96_03G256200 [Sorghum bicolor]|uniref:Uncharacterized protein n=2 Tax=Sorghum bicolor TaxID=4558 RepID=A0A921REN7_SORBI|nr:hypothetical protein BDA96_03G256200 [Sorghum bicolor]OQU87228.1 hypothetical protein SORBI_3003G236450 [Sorghum bicolor]
MTPADDRLEWEAVIGYNLLHLQCICSKDLKPEPTRGVTGTDLFHFRKLNKSYLCLRPTLVQQ